MFALLKSIRSNFSGATSRVPSKPAASPLTNRITDLLEDPLSTQAGIAREIIRSGLGERFTARVDLPRYYASMSPQIALEFAIGRVGRLRAKELVRSLLCGVNVN